MEFASITKFFQTTAPIKHNYRILAKYLKHLNNITEDCEKEQEVSRFRQFLEKNPNIKNKEFDEPIYWHIRNKIYLDSLERFFSQEQNEEFWNTLHETEDVFFPEGREQYKIEHDSIGDPAVGSGERFLDEADKYMKDDPLMKDVMQEIIKSGTVDLKATEAPSLSTILQNPALKDLTDSISSKLSTGVYTRDKLEKTVDNLSQILKDTNEEGANTDIIEMMDLMKTIIGDLRSDTKTKGGVNNIKKLILKLKNINQSEEGEGGAVGGGGIGDLLGQLLISNLDDGEEETVDQQPIEKENLTIAQKPTKPKRTRKLVKPPGIN